ncbi:hypothetical protein AB0M02_44315 [Actinoplanes sp. NPDC051861]|uniref:DUF6907 domain-containing protein n=1 Tax=Actinoplanes sp. NPDC051861 TaxID=3155170 RepID=UPI003423A2D1
MTFPTLRVEVQDIPDWRWYSTRDEDGRSKLVRRLGDRVAEIRWDGEWWQWTIVGDEKVALLRGHGGRLTEALVAAENAQPYRIQSCPSWCGSDHSSKLESDNSRFHSTFDEITVGEGRAVAEVGTCCFTGPDCDSQYGPVVYVSGLADNELTVAEAERLRSALAAAIVRAENVGSLRQEDAEQCRQSSIRQRTSFDMRRFALPLACENRDSSRAA